MAAGIQPSSVACLKVSAIAEGEGVYTNIAQAKSIGANAEQDSIDSTTLGATCGAATAYTTSTDGLEKVTYTFEGFWDDLEDTTGQAAVMDNAVRGAELWFMYYYGDADDAKFIKSRVNVESIEVSVVPDGTVDVSFSAVSTGTITYV